jgi:hypothetical protein
MSVYACRDGCQRGFTDAVVTGMVIRSIRISASRIGIGANPVGTSSVGAANHEFGDYAGDHIVLAWAEIAVAIGGEAVGEREPRRR